MNFKSTDFNWENTDYISSCAAMQPACHLCFQPLHLRINFYEKNKHWISLWFFYEVNIVEGKKIIWYEPAPVIAHDELKCMLKP